jgi:uncharacterized membrane protein
MDRRLRPVHGVFVVLLVMGLVLLADWALEGGFERADYRRVSPDAQGFVRLDTRDLRPLEVRFYRFLNSGNQEVKFFVGRDGEGVLQVAFDAAETDYKRKRGFRQDGEWLVNNKCDTALRLAEVNAGAGGCRPVPLQHRLAGDELVLAEADILQGWRYFR